MIWDWGSFGKVDLTPSVYNTIATIGVDQLAVASVNITNRNNFPVEVNLAIYPTTPPPDRSLLEYKLKIGANETVERTNITLQGESPNVHRIMAYTTAADVTVQAWGKIVSVTTEPTLALSGHVFTHDLVADVLTLSFTAPLEKYCIMSVNFANRNDFSVKVSLANAHTDNPAVFTVNDEDWIEYEYTLFPHETLERTDIALYTANATNSIEFISALSDSNNVSLNVYGIIADKNTEW